MLTAGPGGATWTGLAAEGTWSLDGLAPARLWRQGYQSWSWSGVAELLPPTLDDQGLPLPGGDGDGTSVAFEAPGTSWWGALLGRDQGAALLLAAGSATRSRFFVGAEDGRAWAVWGHRGERIPLPEGATLALDPLVLDLGADPQALLAAWVDVVAARQPPRPLGARPPTGWATWTAYYSAVTEDDVRRELAAARALRDDPALAPLEVFQVDDGWQEAWGVWTAGADFPSGMATLAADLRAAGFTPGLWMAPFYVHRDAEIFAQHPDWWVRGDDGEPLTFTNLGSGDYAVVDATHPEAGPWMAAQVAARVAEGWTYLKLDFLYAGAQEGRRHEDLTGIEAYQRGLALIRAAAPDAWILACGAPFLPTVGFAEQYRTGADIAFEVAPDPDTGFLRWQARSTAARAFTHGAWWWIDPDSLMLRAPYDLARARGAVVAQAVSGGAWLLGDPLDGLPEDRLALGLDADLVDARGEAAVPQAPLAFPSGLDASPLAERYDPDDAVPTTWVFPDGRTALLNLGEDELEVQGPGGTELLTGETAEAGPRTLAPGTGELWR